MTDMFRRVSFNPVRYRDPADHDRKVTQTVLTARSDYSRMAASDFADMPASLSPRMVNFYLNLMELARAVGSRCVPVDFTSAAGEKLYLDRGCIKIAEHAGFIMQLENDSDGAVSQVQLSWRTRPEEA